MRPAPGTAAGVNAVVRRRTCYAGAIGLALSAFFAGGAAAARGADGATCAHIAESIAPTLIFHGDADRPVPIQQAELFVAKLRETGVPAELVVKNGAGHSWANLPEDYLIFADWFDRYLMKEKE